jgi:hypothetical protein
MYSASSAAMMALVMIREREGLSQIIVNLNHVARNTFEILWPPASIDQNISRRSSPAFAVCQHVQQPVAKHMGKIDRHCKREGG